MGPGRLGPRTAMLTLDDEKLEEVRVTKVTDRRWTHFFEMAFHILYSQLSQLQAKVSWLIASEGKCRHRSHLCKQGDEEGIELGPKVTSLSLNN